MSTDGHSWRWLRRCMALVAAIVVACVLTGCCPRCPTERSSKYYVGPTLPLRDVVNEINANNQRIPTLWASLNFQAWVREARGAPDNYIHGDGNLLYIQPGRFRLRGADPVIGTLFDLGTNGDVYWSAVVPRTETMWWGHMRNVGKPCSQALPIRPELVGEVLAVGPIETDFLRPPSPSLRFNHEQDAYMLVYNVRLMDRWASQKEVWYDRASLRPVLVRLYDENGRVLIDAKLADHRPLDDERNGPFTAGTFDVTFPETDSRLVLSINQAKISNKGAPRESAFELPEMDLKVIQLDADCD